MRAGWGYSPAPIRRVAPGTNPSPPGAGGTLIKSNKMTVFVVHPITDKSTDISMAVVFGELKFINSRYVYPDELDGNLLPTPVVQKMLRVVDEFDPDHDYLLIAGDHLQLLAMTGYLTGRWGRFKVLRYDRQAGGYFAVEIGVDE